MASAATTVRSAATAAVEASASTTVCATTAEATSTAGVAAASAASITTAIAAAVTTTSAIATATVAYAATVTTTSVAAVTASAVPAMTPAPTATVPGAGAQEVAAVEPRRAVVAVVTHRRAITVSAYADTHRNLGFRLLCGSEHEANANRRNHCKCPYFQELRKKLHNNLLSGPTVRDHRTNRFSCRS